MDVSPMLSWVSDRGLRSLVVLASLLALVGCAAAPPATNAPTAMLPTTTPRPAPAASPTPRPAPAASPTPRPVPAASPTPQPAPALTVDTGNFTWPIDAPPFPTIEITADSLGNLNRFRAIGVGVLRDASAAPASHTLAVATSAGLALLKLPTFELIRFEPRKVSRVALSPNGGRLLADTDLMDPANGIKIAAISGDLPHFSPDSQLLATRLSASPPQTTVWRSVDGRQIRTIPGDTAAFSPDSQLLAVRTSADVRVLRLSDGQPGRVLPVPGSGIKDLAFSPDGQMLLVALANELQTWRLADGQPMTSLPISHVETPDLVGAGDEEGERVDLSPAGDVFASVVVGMGEGYSYRFELRSTADGHAIEPPGQNAIDESFHFSDDGAAVLRWDNPTWWQNSAPILQMLDLAIMTPRALVLPNFANVAFSPDAQTLASVEFGGNVGLWSVTDGVLQHSLGPECSWGEYDLMFAPDERRLAGRCVSDPPYGDHGESLVVWDLQAGGQELLHWSKSFTSIKAFSPTGMLLASNDTGSALVDAASDSSIPLKFAGVSSAEFSPDGAVIAVGGADGTIHLLQAADGSESAVLQAGDAVNTLFFSPDGTLLGARRADGLVQVWRLGEAVPFAHMATTEGTLLVTSDNQLLISGGPGGVAFYRLSDGKLLRTLDGAADSVAIGPRRRALAIVRNGLIELWGIWLIGD